MLDSLLLILFTIFQVCWGYVWAVKHISIRRARAYADGKRLADTNRRYKVLSFFLFAFQNLLCIAAFWFDSDFLLKIHDAQGFRFLGAAIMVTATVLYMRSLKFLGRNYSPCYDSHLPHELVSGGPYGLIRDPMYLAKVLLGLGTFVISGSLWFVPQLIYLAADMARSIRIEEHYLAEAFPDYLNYRRRTRMLVPFIL